MSKSSTFHGDFTRLQGNARQKHHFVEVQQMLAIPKGHVYAENIETPVPNTKTTCLHSI